MSDASIIDEVGIREANRRAMSNALRALPDSIWRESHIALYVDGRDNYQFPELQDMFSDILYLK
jgi:ribonuclease HII